jgi:hypothetical protein
VPLRGTLREERKRSITNRQSMPLAKKRRSMSSTCVMLDDAVLLRISADQFAMQGLLEEEGDRDEALNTRGKNLAGGRVT